MTDLADVRRLSFSIAYRMLGSVAEAEDIAQEALIRMQNAEGAGIDIESHKAYVSTVTTRLAIDALRSARVRRESYVGSWLPEPVVGEVEPEVERHVEMAESLSMAFLLILETLTPVERAVFLLREVFDYGYDEIARTLEKTEDNCRQIFTRAKRRVEERKPRFEASREKRDALAERFMKACADGDLEGLVHVLADDAVFYGDGGGKAAAVGHPMEGRARVAQLIHALLKKGRDVGFSFEAVRVNGQPGAIFRDAQRRVISVMEMEIVDGKVRAIRSVVNPDKLGHLGPVTDLGRLGGR